MKAQTIVSTKTFTLPSPFSTIESLQDLEIKLGNEDNFQSFVNSYKHVLSNDGRCNGKTGCYKLIDKIFTRELLTKYSFSGGSRDKVIKYSFKQYERIISAFYAIVKNVDSSFSYESCISFFQTVIRNATRRIENDPKKGKMVISRASSGRNRTLTNKKDDETRKENEIGEGNNDNLVTIQPQENNLI
ncbi:uncharacterized protein LOC129611904 [Condylostylus longicornis]|uniref:uncharacterized protein LOC129611904 n=1 Tax=Condylostylus longicornis TaxID=2530218 RepID=UPI00244DBB4C|nr:uncharacterized protein LOC129611904 [Condylostylus longicornis]